MPGHTVLNANLTCNKALLSIEVNGMTDSIEVNGMTDLVCVILRTLPLGKVPICVLRMAPAVILRQRWQSGCSHPRHPDCFNAAAL